MFTSRFALASSLAAGSVVLVSATFASALPSSRETSTCSASMAAVASAQSKKSNIVETAVAAGSFTTLATALEAAGLVEALTKPGPFTVFAPTDAAFAKLPAGTLEQLLKPENKAQLKAILLYHVVSSEVPASKVTGMSGAETLNGQRIKFTASGGTVKANDAKVTSADIACSNGVIHVIDSVLLPSSKNIVETASAAGSFQTLLTAAKAAGLAEVLAGEKELTIFAPTDEAFAALGQETIASLLKPENKGKLADILKYHVVAGRVYSTEAIGNSATSLQGGTLKVTGGETPKVEGARIVTADVDASNGVIHIIDAVLMPPAGGAKR